MPRIQPLMGPMSYKTYTIRPRFRKATCAEIDCKHWRDGWTFALEDLIKDPQLLFMARHSGKRYQEKALNGKTYLVYSPGQPCFASVSHQISIDEQPGMWVGRGDFRTFDRKGLPPNARQHMRTEDWVDDFATHQDKLKTEFDKG